MERLLELASDETGADQPLCEECTHSLFRELSKQLTECQEENSSYLSFLAQLAEEEERLPSEEELDAEIQKLVEEEESLKKQYCVVEEERSKLRQEVERLELEMKKVEFIEERYWQNYSEFQSELENFKEERAAIRRKIDNATEQLERLKNTNVYNDTFHIWHDGLYGTINNFRLGRLPNGQTVEWMEINAAWGQAALLLYTMAKKLNFSFKGYQIVPMGNNSKIHCFDNHTSYELFGSNKLLNWNRSFDSAMVAFLSCLRELIECVRSQDPKFSVPFK